MKNQTQGFTLIELLIVIAIIGILAAVLIPNLLGARRKANDVVAKTYLSDAVKMQEMRHIDAGSYTTTAANLTSQGLKAAPTDVTLNLIGASNVAYCMSVTHANGTVVGAGTKIFAATPGKGIYEVTTANPVCTAANMAQ